MFEQIRLCCSKYFECDCCLNEEEKLAYLIEQQIKQARVKSLYERKVILLGNAEAGKSTFLKQMKLKHGRGFSTEEKCRLIPFINQQIIGVIRCICQAMQTLGIPFGYPQNEECVRILNTTDDDNSAPTLSPEVIYAIRHLWSDEGVQLCYDRRREYRLTDSAKYFCDSIDRICAKDYIPSDDDILRVRIPTTGIVQENFKLSHYRVQIVDVSGQKAERRKWIYCFDNVTTIIFLASLIEYDQYIGDDPSKENLMEESLGLFHVILSSDYFHNASVILFLNKTDLFPDRLAQKPLRYTYPEYEGADDDVEASKEFIKNKYLSVASRRGDMYRDIYAHFTCSVDSKNIGLVFDAIKDKIIDDIIDGIAT